MRETIKVMKTCSKEVVGGDEDCGPDHVDEGDGVHDHLGDGPVVEDVGPHCDLLSTDPREGGKDEGNVGSNELEEVWVAEERWSVGQIDDHKKEDVVDWLNRAEETGNGRTHHAELVLNIDAEDHEDVVEWDVDERWEIFVELFTVICLIEER